MINKESNKKAKDFIDKFSEKYSSDIEKRYKKLLSDKKRAYIGVLGHPCRKHLVT